MRRGDAALNVGIFRYAVLSDQFLFASGSTPELHRWSGQVLSKGSLTGCFCVAIVKVTAEFNGRVNSHLPANFRSTATALPSQVRRLWRRF
jgi:hypothetical protein